MFNRYSILIILSIASFLTGPLSAQQKITFPVVDEATYRFYLEENWDSLIHYGKLAEKQGISYYYLDLRMGIARFEKKQYLLASSWFRKAMSHDNFEDLPMEYLYYTYLYSGQYNRADLVSKHFKSPLTDRIPAARGKFIKVANIETLYSQSNGEKLKEQLWGETLDGIRTITKSMAYFQASFIHQPTPGFTIKHALSYLHKENISYIRSQASEVLFPNQNLNQVDYFISPEITLDFGLTISPSFHYAGMRFEVLEKVNFGYGMNPSTTVGTDSDQFFIGGMELRQRVWLLSLSAGGSYMSKYGVNNYQQQVGMTFYPLGNMNLYAGFDYYFTGSIETDAYLENNIWHLEIGGAIKEKVWIEARYTGGEMKDFRESNNAIFYNSPDYMNRKAQLHITIPRKGQKGVFYIGSRWANHVSPYYLQGADLADMNNLFEYNSLTFYGGISWNIF